MSNDKAYLLPEPRESQGPRKRRSNTDLQDPRQSKNPRQELIKDANDDDIEILQPSEMERQRQQGMRVPKEKRLRIHFKYYEGINVKCCNCQKFVPLRDPPICKKCRHHGSDCMPCLLERTKEMKRWGVEAPGGE